MFPGLQKVKRNSKVVIWNLPIDNGYTKNKSFRRFVELHYVIHINLKKLDIIFVKDIVYYINTLSFQLSSFRLKIAVDRHIQYQKQQTSDRPFTLIIARLRFTTFPKESKQAKGYFIVIDDDTLHLGCLQRQGRDVVVGYDVVLLLFLLKRTAFCHYCFAYTSLRCCLLCIAYDSLPVGFVEGDTFLLISDV